jgi:hypothetical protein
MPYVFSLLAPFDLTVAQGVTGSPQPYSPEQRHERMPQRSLRLGAKSVTTPTTNWNGILSPPSSSLAFLPVVIGRCRASIPDPRVETTSPHVLEAGKFTSYGLLPLNI